MPVMAKLGRHKSRWEENNKKGLNHLAPNTVKWSVFDVVSQVDVITVCES
jgi:hypothetical protein